MSIQPADESAYVGTELELFARAHAWKEYVRSQIAPFIRGRVLEVGAGLGGTTRVLCTGSEIEWICLEPDPRLAAEAEQKIMAGDLPSNCRVVAGTTKRAEIEPGFDTVLYMDVLEHIADDRAEMARAAELLNPGGHVIVLAPAHQWLFTNFDAAIGHERRYTRSTLRRAADVADLREVRARYLDSVGLLASLGNKMLLQRSMPTARQIAFWDRILVRASRLLDPVSRFSVGKSVLLVSRRI
jgi:2-polyprenyl-3-methyl-5-hydroxy-6-metoxy-1,4-benzoquinol methylase